LQSPDKETLKAILTCDEKDEPRVVRESLAYPSPQWQAYHVWMVLDPTWGWDKNDFRERLAVAEDYDAGETSSVEGRDVRVGTKLELIGGREGTSRHYPARD
jgi:hypothetical protein